MSRAEHTELSPIIGIYQELRALQPAWYVEMGQPHGPLVGAQFMQICGAIDAPHSGLQYVVPFFAGTDVVAQMQPSFYPVTYRQMTHLYHRRATCCRYYLVPQGPYCASCPLLSQEERIQRNHVWMQHLLDSPDSA